MRDSLYIVAECGGTHNGNMDTALELIRAAKEAGADAVKFTMRDLSAEMSPQMAAQPYTGPHSYGATYGEHRAALEFSDAQFEKLRERARTLGIDFGLTVCAPSCVERALLLDCAWLKVASRDAGNVPLLNAMASWPGLKVVSDGMGAGVAKAAADLWGDAVILHTVSCYPASPRYLDLSLIAATARLTSYQVGYSDHVPGWGCCMAAIAVGARWLEKHLTLDRCDRGTDHMVSLEPQDFAHMVQDCRELLLSVKYRGQRANVAYPTFAKLGRSVAACRDMPAGEYLCSPDLHMVSPGTGLPWAALPLIVGKTLRVSKAKNELITLEDVE